MTLGSPKRRIGHGAVFQCTSFARVTLSTAEQTIEDYTFHGCVSLEEVAIGHDAVLLCTSPAGAMLGSSVQAIGDYAFCLYARLVVVAFGGPVQTRWHGASSCTPFSRR